MCAASCVGDRFLRKLVKLGKDWTHALQPGRGAVFSHLTECCLCRHLCSQKQAFQFKQERHFVSAALSPISRTHREVSVRSWLCALGVGEALW